MGDPGRGWLDGEPPASALPQPASPSPGVRAPGIRENRGTARSWRVLRSTAPPSSSSRRRCFRPRAEPATLPLTLSVASLEDRQARPKPDPTMTPREHQVSLRCRLVKDDRIRGSAGRSPTDRMTRAPSIDESSLGDLSAFARHLGIPRSTTVRPRVRSDARSPLRAPGR